jgi:cell division septal protein FtsQ
LQTKNKKRKAAYRRSEKLAIFFKVGTIFLLIVVLIAGTVLGIKILTQKFRVREILVSGNYHLDKKDIVSSVKIRKGEPLLKIHLEDVDERLKKSAWIKKVALRRRLPGTLEIKIIEAVPKALLSIKRRLYLIDEDGMMLERIKGETTPFLPVIKDINPKNKKGITEALKLIEVLSEKNNFIDRESIEIGLESYGLTVYLDGEFIKVGYGGYSEKFDKWIELEPELRKRGVPIKYVDLRFKDSVIVKPLKERG